jgi:hypothetical protein
VQRGNGRVNALGFQNFDVFVAVDFEHIEIGLLANRSALKSLHGGRGERIFPESPGATLASGPRTPGGKLSVLEGLSFLDVQSGVT